MLFILICLSFVSCISIKSVDDINKYHIVEAKNNKSPQPNMFTFQISKDRAYFLNYLR